MNQHEENINKLRTYLSANPIAGDEYDKAAAMNDLTEPGEVPVSEVQGYIAENGITLNAYISALEVDVELEVSPATKRTLAIQKGVLTDFKERLSQPRDFDIADPVKQFAFEAAIDVVLGIMTAAGHPKAGVAKAEILALANNRRSKAQVIDFTLGRVRAGHVLEAEL